MAVLALTFGVAANTAIFSVVYATLLAPMPYPNPDQLVMVWSRNPPQIERNSVSAGDFLDWRRQSTVFQGLHAWSGRGVSLGTGRTPEQLQANVGTPGFLTMMGHRFLLGRDFLEEEGEIGNDQVLVLTHRTWQTRFGGDRQIVGRDLRVDGEPYKVVGVLAPGPADRVQGQEVHMPLVHAGAEQSRLPLAARDGTAQAWRHAGAGER